MGGKVCLQGAANCDVYGDTDVRDCKDCSKGYFVNATKKCEACDLFPGCNDCSDADTCTGCEVGVAQHGGKSCVDPAPFCEVFDSQDKRLCSKCQPGYVIDPETKLCDSCQEKGVDHCEECSLNPSLGEDAYICTKCVSGKNLVNDGLLCRDPITNCVSHNTSDYNQCLQCSDTFGLTAD